MHLYSVGKFGSSPLVFSQLKQYFKNGDTCRLSKKYKKPYCSFCQISQMVTLPKNKSIITDMLSELLQAWQRAFISPNSTCGSTFLYTFDFFLPIYPLYTSLFSLYIALSFWDTVLTKNIQYETFWQWCLFSVEFHKDSFRFSHASRVQVCFHCSLVFWDLDWSLMTNGGISWLFPGLSIMNEDITNICVQDLVLSISFHLSRINAQKCNY